MRLAKMFQEIIQNKQKRKKVHAVFYQVGFILICLGKITVIKKNKYIPGNLFFVIISLSLYLRLQITSQQVLSLRC
jgi:hypothetical protein